MKQFFSLASSLLLLSAFSAPVLAQPFTISSFITAGGGGTSTGGVFTVSGTIGQPEAGTSSGGPFTCVGGFWAGVPRAAFTGITIELLGGGRVRVSWPLPESGYVLYHTPSLNGAPPVQWAPVPPPYATNATRLSITDSAPSGFYLLGKP